MGKLNGKVAVITGGNSGIGLATAIRFVEEGAYVYIVGRRKTELDKAKKLIEKNVTTICADVSKLEDIDLLYSTIRSENKRIDIIVAAAGVVDPKPLAETTPENFDKHFNLNARGTFFTVQKSLPLLNDNASIILVGSAMHVMGIPHHAPYAATKAALRSYARTWAAELKGRGIRVNTLSPGVTETPMIDGQGATKEEADNVRKMYLAMIPQGRLADPKEIASGALFLASSDGSYMSGADLMVDGGVGQV